MLQEYNFLLKNVHYLFVQKLVSAVDNFSTLSLKLFIVKIRINRVVTIHLSTQNLKLIYFY